MTRLRRVGRALAALACTLALFLALPVDASAYTGLDLDAPCTLTMAYHPDHGAWNDVKFSLYRVADISNAAQLSLTSEWSGVPVTLDGLDAAGWARLANTLSGYIANGSYTAGYSGKTDAGGNLILTDIKPGVYLLLGDSHNVKETKSDGSVVTYHYEPRPEMVILPYLTADGWVYTRNISAIKYEVTNTTETPTVDRRVIKIWNDSGNRRERPDYIEVALLKNNTVQEVVRLNAANAWRYDWTGLDANAVWRVVELTRPLNYRVESDRSGSTFTLTNTYVEPDIPEIPTTPPPPPDVPEPPRNPDPPMIIVNVPDVDIPEPDVPLTPWVVPSTPQEDLEDPDIPLTTPETPTEDIEDPEVPLEDLPQTGQLWWPVPVLGVLSVLMFAAGVILMRKKDNSEI